MTDAEKFYRDHAHKPVTPEQLETAGATRNADPTWRFKDGSYGEILSIARPVRELGKLYPVATIYFQIVESDDPRVTA